MQQNKMIPTLKNTFLGQCPNCGQGKLYVAFLKLTPECSVCHEDFSDIRADDAPAWLTILIVGHILVPILLFVLPMLNYSDFVLSLIVIVPTLILSLIILPFAKSLFVGILWHQKKYPKIIEK
jgi:uncharacterized protein (DUF983 family)